MSQAVIFGASGGIGSALVAAVVASGRYERVWAGSRAGKSVAGACGFAFDLTDEASIAAAALAMGEGGPLDIALIATGVLTLADGTAPEKGLRLLASAAIAGVCGRTMPASQHAVRKRA